MSNASIFICLKRQRICRLVRAPGQHIQYCRSAFRKGDSDGQTLRRRALRSPRNPRRACALARLRAGRERRRAHPSLREHFGQPRGQLGRRELRRPALGAARPARPAGRLVGRARAELPASASAADRHPLARHGHQAGAGGRGDAGRARQLRGHAARREDHRRGARLRARRPRQRGAHCGQADAGRALGHARVLLRRRAHQPPDRAGQARLPDSLRAGRQAALLAKPHRRAGDEGAAQGVRGLRQGGHAAQRPRGQAQLPPERDARVSSVPTPARSTSRPPSSWGSSSTRRATTRRPPSTSPCSSRRTRTTPRRPSTPRSPTGARASCSRRWTPCSR